MLKQKSYENYYHRKFVEIFVMKFEALYQLFFIKKSVLSSSVMHWF